MYGWTRNEWVGCVVGQRMNGWDVCDVGQRMNACCCNKEWMNWGLGMNECMDINKEWLNGVLGDSLDLLVCMVGWYGLLLLGCGIYIDVLG